MSTNSPAPAMTNGDQDQEDPPEADAAHNQPDAGPRTEQQVEEPKQQQSQHQAQPQPQPQTQTQPQPQPQPQQQHQHQYQPSRSQARRQQSQHKKANHQAGLAGDQQQQVPISADYLAQLIKDKKQLGAFPAVFVHVQRLIDDEINKVRQALFQLNDVVNTSRALELPEAEGEPVQLQEKIYVPVEEHPEYNFVGRLLGPRGMTAKQLEQETGCKIMIRGRGSMRDKKKVSVKKSPTESLWPTRLNSIQFITGGAEQGQTKLGAPERRASCSNYGRGHAKSRRAQD